MCRIKGEGGRIITPNPIDRMKLEQLQTVSSYEHTFPRRTDIIFLETPSRNTYVIGKPLTIFLFLKIITYSSYFLTSLFSLCGLILERKTNSWAMERHTIFLP